MIERKKYLDALIKKKWNDRMQRKYKNVKLLRYKGRDDIIHPLCAEWRKTLRAGKAKMA